MAPDGKKIDGRGKMPVGWRVCETDYTLIEEKTSGFQSCNEAFLSGNPRLEHRTQRLGNAETSVGKQAGM